jgi:hypothetical protein
MCYVHFVLQTDTNVSEVRVASILKVEDFKIVLGVKMEAAGLSEMMVLIYRATRRHILTCK